MGEAPAAGLRACSIIARCIGIPLLRQTLDIHVAAHLHGFAHRSATDLTVVMWMQHQFYNRIAQLVYTFPEDAVTSTGTRFWSAPKRFPTPLPFDEADSTQANTLQAAAVLRAEVYGIPLPDWAADPAQVDTL